MKRPRAVHEIVPGKLYQAATPSKWAAPDRADARSWLNERMTYVVVLCKRDAGLSSTLPDHPLTLHNVYVSHTPVVDSHKTVDDRIPSVIVPDVLQRIDYGWRVVVTCLAGRSRSGATCALVVRELYGMSGAEALDFVREGRPNAIKREGPEAWIRALPPPEPRGTVQELVAPGT